MNINTFYCYTLDERVDIINRYGDYISKIKCYGFWIKLYLIDDVFIEVFYNINDNMIEDIEPLEPNDERVNLYASYVDISDLGI